MDILVQEWVAQPWGNACLGAPVAANSLMR